VHGWVMVFAESFIAANRADDLVKVLWSSGKAATVSERDIQNRAAELIAESERRLPAGRRPGRRRGRSRRRSRRSSEPTPRAP